MRAFAKEWLKAAKDDLMTIEEIIDNIHLTNIVAFHSQQCVEKTLKALIENSEQNVPKSHKLIQLNKIVSNQIGELNNDLLNLLDQLYIESRYPGDMGILPYGKPTIEDAKEFYKISKNLFEKVCKILNVNIS